MTKTKKSSRKYLILLALLCLYFIGILIAAIICRIEITWVFYGLIPSAISIGVALYAYQDSHYREIHTDQYLHQIADDMADVKTYVAEIAGVDKGFDF